jgi:hypothetical protein
MRLSSVTETALQRIKNFELRKNILNKKATGNAAFLF